MKCIKYLVLFLSVQFSHFLNYLLLHCPEHCKARKIPRTKFLKLIQKMSLNRVFFAAGSYAEGHAFKTVCLTSSTADDILECRFLLLATYFVLGLCKNQWAEAFSFTPRVSRETRILKEDTKNSCYLCVAFIQCHWQDIKKYETISGFSLSWSDTWLAISEHYGPKTKNSSQACRIRKLN